MEDCVSEAQSLLPPLNLNPKDNEENASTVVDEDQVKEEPATTTRGGGGENGGGEGGIIKNLISNFFHPTEGVGIIENEKDDRDNVPKLETPVTAASSGGGGENGGGGIINSLVSNLFHPTEGVGIIENEKYDEDDIHKIETPPSAAGRGGNGGDGNGGGEGTGIISNLISHLFHPSKDGSRVENEKDDEEKKVRVVEENEESKKDEEGDEGKGGIIDNIVSHLPTSLPDDAVPTSDEATILINSLVRD